MKQINDIKSPFNLYDFFGYLLPGFFLVALYVVEFDLLRRLNKANTRDVFVQGHDYMELETRLAYLKGFLTNFSEDYKVIPFICFVLFCYLLGHIIAAFSSMFIERQFVKKLLGLPAANLFRSNHFVRNSFFFGNYRRPFKQSFQAEFSKTVAKTFGYKVYHEDYYWICYTYVHYRSPLLFARLQHFVNLSGFTRNVCATFIFYLLVRLPFMLLFPPLNVCLNLAINLVFLGAAFILFWSYLKFLKRQAVDLFYSFYILAVEEKTEATPIN